MLPKTRKVVSPKKFDELFREEALVAEFASGEEESAYERRDSFLIHLIRREVQQHFGTDKARQPFVGEDWWRDHTRHIEATPVHCTLSFLNALHGLLSDDHKHYRIQICVYGNTGDGKTYIGSMALYADRMVIETKLHALLEKALGDW